MADDASLQGEFALKNTLDFSDDVVLFDSTANPISFIKNVVAQSATPNTFRTRKRFYGRFITQLWDNGTAGKEGPGMWDDVLAALKRATGESTQEMNLFVAIVHVEELQSYPFPEASDFDAIMKIANNGGIFKSYVYNGLPPAYGDNVLVSFADPATRSEGVFEHPLVGGAAGGAAAGSIGAAGGGSGGGGARFGSCKSSPRAKAKRPAATTATSAAATPAAATPAAAPATPPAPQPAAAKNQTPDVAQPETALPRCTKKGKRIFWVRSGQASDMPQIGPNRIFGTDWSGWNRISRLPFDKIRAEGIEYSMIKLTQKTKNSNKFVEGQISGAKSEGILIGPYHFCGSQAKGDPETLAKREFAVFAREITKSGRHWDLAPALDFESGRCRTGKKPTPWAGSQTECSRANCIFYLKFCQLLFNEFKVKPMIYTAGWARGAYMNGIKDWPEWKEIGQVSTLWWAEYDRTRDQSKTDAVGGRKNPYWDPWKGYDIWQFSGWGRFESLGGKGKFDFNSMKKSSLSKLKMP